MQTAPHTNTVAEPAMQNAELQALTQSLENGPQDVEVDLTPWVSTLGQESPQTQPSTLGTGQQPQDLVLSASRKIVLQCGLCSITLHANGKVVLRGQSIVSAAEGINRLAGGQIEIN